MKPSQRSVQRVEVDAGVRAEFAADYSDAFRIAALPGYGAREWAQRSLRGADPAHGLFGRVAWGGLLGFQLAAPDAPGTLFGWQIAVEEPEVLLLETDGRLMAGRMVFQASDTALTWTTMLRYHHPAARPIWLAAGPVHRALTPRCLQVARHSLQRSTLEPDTASRRRDGSG